MGIKEEITKIAVEQGYDGAKPKSIAQAIDALTDTLAGEDVKSGRSVVDAIRKYAPYVGGGGITLGALVYIEVNTDIELMDMTPFNFWVSTEPYDISDEIDSGIEDLLGSTTNVCSTGRTDFIKVPSGCYVTISGVVPEDWSADSLGVYIGEEPVASGFEYKKLVNGSNSVVFFTMQIPETSDEVYVNFDVES